MASFPNVPNVPGVPALPRDPGAALAATLILLTEDILSGFVVDQVVQWGLYLDGVPAVTPDTVVSFDYRQSWNLSDYPVEQGGFETYNKVNTPFDARMRVASGKSEINRQLLLDQVAAVGDTLDLYDVVTPEVVYRSVNVSHFDYRRSARNGVGLVTVDIWLTEVRVTGKAEFSSTKAPGGANQTNGGTVQTSPATPQQASTAPSLTTAGH